MFWITCEPRGSSPTVSEGSSLRRQSGVGYDSEKLIQSVQGLVGSVENTGAQLKSIRRPSSHTFGICEWRTGGVGAVEVKCQITLIIFSDVLDIYFFHTHLLAKLILKRIANRGALSALWLEAKVLE